MFRNLKVKVHIVAIFSIGLLTSCYMKHGHPTDEELLGNWQTHKTDFDQLLQMFQTDKKLSRVSFDFTRPEHPDEIGISIERVNKYKGYFNKLGLTAGIEGYDERDTIWFYSSTQGLAVSGSSKGYAYLEIKPKLIVDDLDKYWSKDGKSFTAFKNIEGNWYLYLQFQN